jgi:hypothetical protein
MMICCLLAAKLAFLSPNEVDKTANKVDKTLMGLYR